MIDKMNIQEGLDTQNLLKMKIKIIIADEHELFREGLVKLFRESKNIEILEQASDGEELLKKAKTHNPHIVLMDIGNSKVNEVKTIELLRYYKPSIKVIGLSVCADSDRVKSVLRAGASGFLIKCCDYKQLKECIIKVFSGNYYLCDSTIDLLLNSYTKAKDYQ